MLGSLLCAMLCAVEPAAAQNRMALDPAVPFGYGKFGVEQGLVELRRIRAETGLRRFFVTGSPVSAKTAADIGTFKKALEGTDIEISWWCAPSLRYESAFDKAIDFSGNASTDNKNCPLDPAFAADFTAKVCAVAKSRPKFICIEDDFTLAWGRGLDRLGPCFCARHLSKVAERYGKPVTAREIALAFKNQTAENLPLRRAFADAIRESLVQLAHKVREGIDRIDPTIRVVVCQPAGCDKDGDSTEAVARAFAGKTRPAVRPFGAIYGGETIPAIIPRALAHTVWTLEHLPRDIETFYEADTYPHNRFYSSASQLLSLMAGALMAGTDDFLFYCLQYLDDPLEDRGYVDAFLRTKPRLERAKRFIRERDAHLAGVREVWTPDDVALTREMGEGHGTSALAWMSYALERFSVPYTTRAEGANVAMLVDGTADALTDEEIRRLLSNGLFVDARAAEILTKRGFGKYLGTDVETVQRLSASGEVILPAAGCKRVGKRMNCYFLRAAGSENTVERFLKLTPHEGTEVLCQYLDAKGEALAPSVTYATNALGGRVAVMATSLPRNRTSGLYNLRKQELMQRLFARMAENGVPVMAAGTPGIWLLANVSADRREMLVMANNLSGDVREDVILSFSPEWRGGKVARIDEQGREVPLGAARGGWRVPLALGNMAPEFFLIRK